MCFESIHILPFSKNKIKPVNGVIIKYIILSFKKKSVIIIEPQEC